MIQIKEEGPFNYAGLENGDGCYCGNSEDKFIPTDPEECNAPCSGDPNELCGGSWRLQVYDIRLLGDQDHESTTANPLIGEEAGDALGELSDLH